MSAPLKPTPGQRHCEICKDPLHGNNRIGICGNPEKPECAEAYSRAIEVKRGRGATPEAEKRGCEVCGRPIRKDNKSGICGNQESTACMTERKRREAERSESIAYRIKISKGDTFGRWTALEDYSFDNKEILVQCECGFKRRLAGRILVNGHSRQCKDCALKFRKRPENVPYIAAGTVFGRLTVLEDVQNSTDRAFVRCTCEGNEKWVHAVGLKNGAIKSCGCLRVERKTTHGFSKHPLYATWNGMIDRCTNPKDPAYHNYGGRLIPGPITVCERWFDPWLFAEDIEREIGPRPEDRDANGRVLYELDRTDNDCGYGPGNVRWADKKTQRANQRTVASVTREWDAERDAFTAQVDSLKTQLRAAAEQLQAPRKRKVPTPREEPLF